MIPRKKKYRLASRCNMYEKKKYKENKKVAVDDNILITMEKK